MYTVFKYKLHIGSQVGMYIILNIFINTYCYNVYISTTTAR